MTFQACSTRSQRVSRSMAKNRPVTEAMRAAPSRSSMKARSWSAALFGAQSRPSVKTWTTTSRPPAARALARAATCRWWLCTPPVETRPIRWQVPPLFFRASITRPTAGCVARLPSSIAALIRGRSCSTTRPAPRFMWPTSELPICPSGRPTNAPDAFISPPGQRAARASTFGVFARATALFSRSVR